MSYFIILIGVIFMSGGVIITFKPEIFIDLLRDNSESLNFRIAIAVISLTVGVALVLGAADSKYPMLLLVIGWIAILKGVFSAVLGREYFKKRIDWSLKVISPIAPAIGLIELAFGILLVYAIV